MALPEGLLGRQGESAIRSETAEATCETASVIVANIPATQASGSRPASAATRAVFLDALGTLVELEPPWVGLAGALGEEVDQRRLIAAVRAEMAYYREHSDEGRDETSLADLRRRCAAVLSERLGVEVAVGTLMEAIRFQPFPDAAPGLAALRARGLTTVCVSNWDISLSGVLERCGLRPALDAIVCSAEAGAREARPGDLRAGAGDRGLLARARPCTSATRRRRTSRAPAPPGMRALLIDRDGGGDISSLDEVAALV